LVQLDLEKRPHPDEDGRRCREACPRHDIHEPPAERLTGLEPPTRRR
jgi:hypothetical protein